MIDGCSFGGVEIDGRTYDSDVIVYRDRVEDGWWRAEGHEIAPEDLREVLAESPDVLVAGVGHAGRVEILPETKSLLADSGIELVAARTPEACEIYNERLQTDDRVIAALHLTC